MKIETYEFCILITNKMARCCDILSVHLGSIAAKYLRALSGLFSPNLIDRSSCRMGLVLACVVRILHDDWSIRLGENRLDMVLKHLGAMLT